MNHRRLYTLLFRKNRELAKRDRRGIFTHRTLREMSKRLPLTEVEFRRIHGVGPVKTERYAEIFLQIIHDYCVENRLRKLGQNPELEEKRAPRQNETPAEAAPAPSVADDEYADPRDYARIVYERLEELRARLSNQRTNKNCPFFTRTAMKQIAVLLPRTHAALRWLPDVRAEAVEQYGESVLQLIQDFCQEHGFTFDQVRPRTQTFLYWLIR